MKRLLFIMCLLLAAAAVSAQDSARMEIHIQALDDQYVGTYSKVPIYAVFPDSSFEIGGFDLLLGYDDHKLNLIDVETGDFINDCQWEYFTYRSAPISGCDFGCPSGLLRLIAIADINNGLPHPSCLSRNGQVELATITFLTPFDFSLDHTFIPIYWIWPVCDYNTFISSYRDTIYTNNHVITQTLDINREFIQDITLTGDFPLPAPNGAPDSCLSTSNDPIIRNIDFHSGGILLDGDNEYDDRGDVNVNGIRYEIADAVMLASYFINGVSAFAFHVDASIAASDANRDGTTLQVADLVYINRVIVGDAQYYLIPNPNARAEFYRIDGEIFCNANVDLGAVLLIFDGTATPELQYSSMDMQYGSDSGQTHVLIYNIGDEYIPAGKNIPLLSIADAKLISAEASDYNGSDIDSIRINNYNYSWQLAQNYPNPVINKTNISLNLSTASAWTIIIYNIAGQQVREYAGTSEAGRTTITWDGTDYDGKRVAAGIYFYKAEVEGASQTKKMILVH